jgi:hypothetical protein
MTTRKQSGHATSDLIVSAHMSNNSPVLDDILKLHVAENSVIADITYGLGAFWKDIDTTKYVLHGSDLKTGTDWKNLPYADNSIDVIVFDPPYIEGFYRKKATSLAGVGSHSAFQTAYSNSDVQTTSQTKKYHDAVIEAYLSVIPEVNRVLKKSGKFIIKCQDEVSSNAQKLTHVELIYAYEHHKFYCKDLFVVMRNNKPNVSRILQQVHARKNHSYFLVFEKQCHKKTLTYSNFKSWLLDTTMHKEKEGTKS